MHRLSITEIFGVTRWRFGVTRWPSDSAGQTPATLVGNMAATGLSPTERAERAERTLTRQRKEKQAMKLRLVEGGAFAAGSFGLGGLKARFPDTVGAGWFGGRLHLEHVLALAGGLMLLTAKGATQEAGSGLLYAGAGPVLAGLGARVLTPG